VVIPACQTLFGHDDEVSAVAVNCELDVVVSGGNDGSVLLHTLRSGTFVWSASVCADRVNYIRISPTNGLITVYSQKKFTLALLNINGKLLQRIHLHDRLSDMIISRDGEYLITCGSNSVVFRTLHDLGFSQKFPVTIAVNCMCMTPDSMYLLLGMKDGSLQALGKNPNVLTQPGGNRLIHRFKTLSLRPRTATVLTSEQQPLASAVSFETGTDKGSGSGSATPGVDG